MRRLSRNIISKDLLILEYTINKLSSFKIGIKYNFSKHSILRLLNKYNIKKRTNKEGRNLIDLSGVNSPLFIHGKKSKCIDCNKIISYKAKRCKTCENIYRGKLGIYKNINLGSKNGRFREGKPHCVICNKIIWYGCNICWECWLNSRDRENNPNWKGGISNLPYALDFNSKLKQQIRERDNFTCQNCGMTEEEHLLKRNTKLNIHHVDYNKQNCEKDNLITVCHYCNSKANGNRDYWYAFYKYIIDNKMYKEKI